MLSGISASLSGLMASQTKLHTTAHNLANANTDGFKKAQVILEESEAGGVQARLDRVETPGMGRPAETAHATTTVEQSNVDLGEASIELLPTRRFFDVNLRALDAQQETIGVFLDLRE